MFNYRFNNWIFPSTPKLMIYMMVLFFSIIVHYFINNTYYNIQLEIEKCPFCYGNNICAFFDNNQIAFNNLTFNEKISNIITIKNVFHANYNNNKVILKKLGHNWELDEIDNIICKDHSMENCPPYPNSYNEDFTTNIYEFLLKDNKNIPVNFKLCSLSTINEYTNILFALNSHLNTSVMTANIWTTLLANAEPLLLQILNAENGWPVPKYYGACGRVIVEEYCGKSLYKVENESWNIRSKLALKLLQAADDFTNKHPLFRIYLTDISSDNIVVTDENDIKFVDLENVIIKEKHFKSGDARIHESRDLEDCKNCYAFSSEEICAHSISDHNFYSVCKLLLSKNAPWPMMEQGLLHTPPLEITEKYPELFEYIEICVDSNQTMNRFEASKKLMNILEVVINETKSN